MPPSLLWHRSVPYYDEGDLVGRYPAMIAPIRQGSKVIAFHVTYLENGRKAVLNSARKVIGGRCNGGAVHLYPPGKTLGVAEGIETAIAAHELFGVPVWSTLNTSLMKNFTPPEGVEKLIIFADHDANYAGHAAAYVLAHKMSRLGTTCEVRMPDQVGDWNDVLLARKTENVA